MPLMDVDRETRRKLIRRRRRLGIDKFDEVWDGVYIMSPGPGLFHQKFSYNLAKIFESALESIPDAGVYLFINVSDRPEKWRENFRLPDVSVILPGNPAQERESHLFGGPDFIVEVVSPGDRSREKLDFYAKVGTREALFVDRKPWSLELYRVVDGTMQSVGKIKPGSPERLTSEVFPVSFGLIPSDPRPMVEVIRTQDARRWLA